MSNIKSVLVKTGKGLASIAFFAAILSANTTCLFVYHQPKIPAGLERLKKI